MTRRQRTTIAGVLAPAIVVASAVVVLAQGSVGIRLLEAPVDRAGDPRAQIYIIDHLSPGDEITRRVEITNTTPDDLPVRLYPGAADIDDGRWRSQPGEGGNELAGWVTIEPATVTVPPDGASEAVVRITIPSDASAGERYAVAWAEPQVDSAGDVRVVNRVGVRIYLSVGEGGEPSPDFEIINLEPRRDVEEGPVLLVHVENTGGRAVDLGGELRLIDGPGGIQAGPVDPEQRTTLSPGQGGAVRFILDPALPDGPWRAEVTLRSGELERTASATVTFSADASGSPVTVDDGPEPRDLGLALPLAVALLLLVLLALLWVLSRRRRDAGEEHRQQEDRASVGA